MHLWSSILKSNSLTCRSFRRVVVKGSREVTVGIHHKSDGKWKAVMQMVSRGIYIIRELNRPDFVHVRMKWEGCLWCGR